MMFQEVYQFSFSLQQTRPDIRGNAHKINPRGLDSRMTLGLTDKRYTTSEAAWDALGSKVVPCSGVPLPFQMPRTGAEQW